MGWATPLWHDRSSMEDLPTTAPHFIGLGVAVFGLAVAVYSLSRPSVRARLGAKRRRVGAVVLVFLLLVGTFGNGIYGVAQRGTLWTGFTLASGLPFSTQRVEDALAVAFSPEFVAYHGALVAETMEIEGADVQARLETTWKSPQAVPGAQTGSVLPPGAMMLTHEYYDVHNFAFELVGFGTAAMRQRYELLDAINHDYLDELVALQYLRHAPDPAQRIAALQMLHHGVPDAAEWIVRELDRIDADGLTEPERTALTATRDLVQRYIDDPTMRALPEGFHTTLD